MDSSQNTEKQELGKLDETFKAHLDDMKDYVLNIKDRNRKQNVTSWIKKLCNPQLSTLIERKNRNLYAQILFKMLRNEDLQEPFNDKPPRGKLPTIPAYMSVYLDESDTAIDKTLFDGPDWLEDDISWSGSDIFTSSKKAKTEYKDVFTPRKRERFLIPKHLLEMDDSINFDLSTEHLSTKTKEIKIKDTDADLDLNDEILGYVEEKENINPKDSYLDKYNKMFGENEDEDDEIKKFEKSLADVGKNDAKDIEKSLSDSAFINEKYEEYLKFTKQKKKNNTDQDRTVREKKARVHTPRTTLSREKELELKLRTLEGRTAEEKLKMQQRHDLAVQKVLDRKNTELTDAKKYYQSKIEDLEDSLKKQDKKVTSLSREFHRLKDMHSKEKQELNRAIEQTSISASQRYEKLYHDKVAEIEQEKFDLQKAHHSGLQDVIEECNEKIQLMKQDFIGQIKESKKAKDDLESQLKNERSKTEESQSELSKLSQTKEELQEKVTRLLQQLEEGSGKITSLEKEHSRLIEEYESVVKDLKKKQDETFENLKKEKSAAASKAAGLLSDLEMKLAQSKQSIQDLELERKRDLREQDANHKQEMLQCEIQAEKKNRLLQSEFEEKEIEMQSKVRKAEQATRQKEEELKRLSFKLSDQTREAETAIESFKKQAQDNSGRMFEDMNAKISNLETQLANAKEINQQQKNEFRKKVSELEKMFENEHSRTKQQHDDEKAKIHSHYQEVKQQMLQQFDEDKKNLLSGQEVSKKELESRLVEQQRTHNQVCQDLEKQLAHMREEVLQANTLRKDQLQEVAVMRDEEKQNTRRQEQALHAGFLSQMEQQKMELQKEHSQYVMEITDKSTERLRSLEADYKKRLKKEQENLLSLKNQLREQDEAHNKKISSLKKVMDDMKAKYSTEKDAYKQDFLSKKKLQSDELELQTMKSKQMEKKISRVEMEYKEKISRMKLENEEKMKGMMPADLQKELEDTIESLRQQVAMLQSRADVLQEELTENTKFLSSRRLSDKQNVDS